MVAVPVAVHPALTVGQTGTGVRVDAEVPAIDPAKLSEGRVPISEAEGVVEVSPRSQLGADGTGHSADVADRLARCDLPGCKAGAPIETGPNTRLLQRTWRAERGSVVERRSSAKASGSGVESTTAVETAAAVAVASALCRGIPCDEERHHACQPRDCN